MADTHVVSTVDHAKGAESEKSGSTTQTVERGIVHENADTSPRTMVQKVTETVAQGVQSAKDAVVGKADHSGASAVPDRSV
jgi:hypothetical protein